MFSFFCLSCPSFIWKGKQGRLGEYGSLWHKCILTQLSSSFTLYLKLQSHWNYKRMSLLPACFLVVGGMGRRQPWLTGSWLLRATHLLSPLPSSPKLNITRLPEERELAPQEGGRGDSERVEEEMKAGWNFPEISWAPSPLASKSSLFEACWLTVAAGTVSGAMHHYTEAHKFCWFCKHS